MKAIKILLFSILLILLIGREQALAGLSSVLWFVFGLFLAAEDQYVHLSQNQQTTVLLLLIGGPIALFLDKVIAPLLARNSRQRPSQK
jgi:hypothetical protein